MLYTVLTWLNATTSINWNGKMPADTIEYKYEQEHIVDVKKSI